MRKLEAAGAIVAESNFQAALLCRGARDEARDARPQWESEARA